jgi:spermidine synthase
MAHSTLFCLAITFFSGTFLIQFLFWSYRVQDKRPRWIAALDFTPHTMGGAGYEHLAIASLLGLFLELAMIRWVSSEVRIFAYFKNFVLLACFLGFGLGCYFSRRKINALAIAAPLLLLVILVSPGWQPMHDFVAALPEFLAGGSEVNIWGVPSMNISLQALPVFAGAALVSALLFFLIVFSFIPIGQVIGWHLENASHGIIGYTVNVLASIVGIVFFTVLCFSYQPPPTWFAIAGLMYVLLLRKLPLKAAMTAAAFAICVLHTLPHSRPELRVYWSPYQKLSLRPVPNVASPEIYSLSTNDNWYQQILNLSPDFVHAHPEDFEHNPIQWNAYNVPYRFYPAPESVLVLGSGMGNDVAAALRHGAAHVVAVEIDPLILKLGRELHFEHPYASPRVRLVLDDARNYIQNTDDRFDLVVFSLLDSHTTSSHYSNIRIDDYVYTVQALSATRRLLKPGGICILKFWVTTPWVGGRLEELLQNTFRQSPVRLVAKSKFASGGYFFVVGSRERINSALDNPETAGYVQRHGFQVQPAALTTDDWPYFYQREPGLPLNVIVLSLLVGVICAVFIGSTGETVHNIRWHFFFLGAGFLLLEAQSVSKMALLFGTTWIVNSIVISMLLLLIVGANLLVNWRERIPYWIPYGGIFTALAAAWTIPLQTFFLYPIAFKAMVAGLVLCLPVFFAGIIFIRSFARAGFASEALGSNLLGALAGGLLESLSLWTGLRSLLLIAAVLYLASALSLKMGRLVVLKAASGMSS